MVTTQSGIGSGNLQPKPQVIEHAPEVAVAPGLIIMAGVQAMVWIMLDQHMEERRRLLRQSKDKLTVPVCQAPTIGATIWVAKSVEEIINDKIANKVEIGKKWKFEGSSSPTRATCSQSLAKDEVNKSGVGSEKINTLEGR